MCSGRLEILNFDFRTRVKALSQGNVFGEAHFIEPELVSTCVRAVDFSDVSFLSSIDFEGVVCRFPGLRDKVNNALIKDCVKYFCFASSSVQMDT